MCFDYPPQVPHFGADCAENRRIVFLNIHYEPLRSLRLCVKKIVLSVSKLFHSSKLFDISGRNRLLVFWFPTDCAENRGIVFLDILREPLCSLCLRVKKNSALRFLVVSFCETLRFQRDVKERIML
jgi:hypothetical protein